MYRLASGRLLNHLRRAWRDPVFDVGTADPAFPIARAKDHRIGSAAFFLDTEENSAIVVDKGVLTNGDFSTDPLEGWEVTEGDLTAGGVLSGNPTTFYQDFAAVPGEVWSARISMSPGEGGSPNLTAWVRNLQTGRYLTPAGSWVEDVTPYVPLTESGTVDFTRIFQVEPFSACYAPEVQIRVTVTGHSTAEAGIYEIDFWPHTDLVGVFGDNFAPGGLVPKIIDEDASGYEVRLRRDGPRVLWAYLGECKSYRSLRFEWTGTPVAPIGFGELVLTQSTKIARANAPGGVAPRPDLEVDTAFANDRATAPSGALYVTPNGSDVAARSARMSFMLTREAELVKLRDEVFAASMGGVYPSIIVGPSAIGDICMFGRFEDRMPQSFPGGNREVIVRVELGFQEDPFPQFGRVPA